MATLKDFNEWLNDLTRFASPHARIEETEASASPIARERSVRIYTDTNVYTIRAREEENSTGYLGCTAASRKPRAGETWERGNDLHDGHLSKKTWRRILCDIVSYEMVRVHVPRERPQTAEMPGAAETGSLQQGHAAGS